MHHLSNNQRADTRHPDTVRGFSDCLAGHQTAVDDKGFRPFNFSRLEISQNDMELVHEFVIERAKRVQHVSCSGQFIGQRHHLRFVMKDAQHAGTAGCTLNGQFAGQNLTGLNDAGTIVNSLSGAGGLNASALREDG